MGAANLDLDEITQEILAFAELQVKDVLGDAWEQNHNDIENWTKMVAQLQFHIMAGQNPVTTEVTEKYVYAGLAALKRKLQSRVRDQALAFLETMLDFILEKAIMVGTVFLEQQAKNFLEDELFT